ncbi:Na+/H+ antiporter NhaC [Phocicoccus pinnipedialis]|uniref:Na(+)/H(+) antiporter NhaC n=1 Tax=Phocicoccus pinnipedialis TaxID=110845 RepID=A0A6V7RCI0_9BACL|nr:Na+/H+ antiporter NhaC [Jeotgalicoccus pinnipedialis]MBP1939893.1 NhaC family Na+:H+ antiporter [Jeotgalicoccus pinnipedialis]CAD2074753.1 Na(+)/H(+) antiporter NhaC [Jeotgalicoccus pinnipedialis]
MSNQENTTNVSNKLKSFNVFVALVPLTVMIITMLYSVIVLDVDPHIPLIVGTATASIVALYAGYKWHELEDFMYKGIRLALPAVLILLLVGLVIGSWIGGGIVATMIYYGLQLISPTYFLVTILFICSIISLVIGSSWSTIATVGVAGMGIGLSMGINPAMIAGAVISGAYFGDKMSPLSDTTTLASGLTHVDLFEHIKHMFWTTIPGLIITSIVFYIIGLNVIGTKTAHTKEIDEMMQAMQTHFVISPWLFLIPVIVLMLIIFKMPAAPALFMGALLGFLSHLFIQGGTLASAVETMATGYVIESSNESVNVLFNRGGFMDMMYTISMVIISMTFAGIMEYSGMLSSIMQYILKVAKGTFGLITATLASAIFVNVSCAEQYISIVVPSRMYLRSYINQNLAPKNLSRTLEDGGTLSSVFVPWSTDGVFILGTLGVAAWEYGPFTILNFTVPLIAMILAATGIGITKISNTEKDELLERIYGDEKNSTTSTDL